MSGGPPHHQHSRQTPATNTAWNHLQVPNYFPSSRQPQHAHMSNDHPLLHQSTWHTPTTEPLKPLQHSHLLNIEKMLTDRQYPRHTPGVDLTLTRNGSSQNGDLPPTPISLSVRDTNKINSLPVSALEIQAVELTKCTSPGLKSVSPGLKSLSPGLKHVSPGIANTNPNLLETQGSPKSTTTKRSTKRVDSILERLNPIPEKNILVTTESSEKQSQSVIVQAASSSHDENSNSSSILNVLTPTNTRDDDVISPYSNDDSLDSNKSRRKRKPSKTVRVTKDNDKIQENDLGNILKVEKSIQPADSQLSESKTIETQKTDEKVEENKKIPERRRSSDDLATGPLLPRKTRRKTSSESETIANIAAMVQESFKGDDGKNVDEEKPVECDSKSVSVSVIKSNDNLTEPIITPAQKKATTTSFVEVENKLEEMFAGIEDAACDQIENENIQLDDAKNVDNILKLDDSVVASTSQNQDGVTSTSNDLVENKSSNKKTKVKSTKGNNSRRSSDCNSIESTPKKKKSNKKSKTSPSKLSIKSKNKNKKGVNIKQAKIEAIKDIYAYDSGSNASSSKSKGPFIQIRGPRDSPISVNVINTPLNDDDVEKKLNKSKKFHDDSEYRHKVRSKGLHCSTLSNKYDAQTKDVSWICAFCKRGPHATEPNTTGPTVYSSDVFAPGDLFGPYIITTQSPEYERRLEDPYDKQFKSKKVSRTLDMNSTIKISGKKSKRKHSESYDNRLSIDSSTDCADNYLGVTEMANRTYEIWAHEDCIVWSPGIYLIGPKIVGLEEAVWTSCNVTCNRCHLKGANICCLKRGCTSVMHFICARISAWQLDEDSYKAFCVAHKK